MKAKENSFPTGALPLAGPLVAPVKVRFAGRYTLWVRVGIAAGGRPALKISLAREDKPLLTATLGQGPAHDEVRAYLDDALARQDPALATLTQVDKGHGRLETRRYWQSDRLGWFADREKWAGLRSVGVVEATRRLGAKESMERRYYLSSLPVDVAQLA